MSDARTLGNARLRSERPREGAKGQGHFDVSDMILRWIFPMRLAH